MKKKDDVGPLGVAYGSTKLPKRGCSLEVKELKENGSERRSGDSGKEGGTLGK